MNLRRFESFEIRFRCLKRRSHPKTKQEFAIYQSDQAEVLDISQKSKAARLTDCEKVNLLTLGYFLPAQVITKIT
jgi:hypothetical protein